MVSFLLLTLSSSKFPALGSPLDKTDKYLTSFVNNLYVSYLEYPLSAVGCFFGIPVTSMALCPLIAAAVASKDTTLVLCASIATLAALVVWFYKIAHSSHESFYAVPSKVLFLTIFTVQLSCLLIGGTAASSPASWYLCSYLTTQVIVLTGKAKYSRMRPAHAQRSTLLKIPRLLPRLTFLATRGPTVFEAFPSGDAAGGAVFSLVLVTITGHKSAYLFAAFAALGRMYLFAHHLLDVATGCAIAYVCTTGITVVHGRAMGEVWGVGEAVCCMGGFIVFYKKVIKHRTKLPRQWESKTGDWGMDVDEGGKK